LNTDEQHGKLVAIHISPVLPVLRSKLKNIWVSEHRRPQKNSWHQQHTGSYTPMFLSELIFLHHSRSLPPTLVFCRLTKSKEMDFCSVLLCDLLVDKTTMTVFGWSDNFMLIHFGWWDYNLLLLCTLLDSNTVELLFPNSSGSFTWQRQTLDHPSVATNFLNLLKVTSHLVVISWNV